MKYLTKCPKCGGNIDTKFSSFCPYCGNSLVVKNGYNVPKTNIGKNGVETDAQIEEKIKKFDRAAIPFEEGTMIIEDNLKVMLLVFGGLELVLVMPISLAILSAIVGLALSAQEYNSLYLLMLGAFEGVTMIGGIHVPLLAFFLPTFFIIMSRRSRRKEIIKNHDFEETGVLLEILGDSSPDADSNVKLKIDNFNERFLVLHRKSRFFEKKPKINGRYKVYGYKETYALVLMEEKNGGN